METVENNGEIQVVESSDANSFIVADENIVSLPKSKPAKKSKRKAKSMQTATSEPEPVVEESEPVVEETEHVVEEREPVIEESEPVVEETEHVVEEREPVIEEPEPVIEEPEPVLEEPLPNVQFEIVEEPVIEESLPNVQFEIVEEPVIEETIPKLVFIVPYRDRIEHYNLFDKHMKHILENIPESDYKIYYIHQKDERSFNRGAMKNIGFLYVKNKYPEDYKNITLVFNDVDTMPSIQNLIDYNTLHGTVKHFYGYKFTLGGIVSIKGSDFERINGFPNYWAWGYEDNALQRRVLSAKMMIDRRQFYDVHSKNIIHLNDSYKRIVNRNEFERYVDEHKYTRTNDGISTIHNLSYEEDEQSNFVNVNEFKTAVDETPEMNQIHDLRNGSVPFKNIIPKRSRGIMGMMFHK